MYPLPTPPSRLEKVKTRVNFFCFAYHSGVTERIKKPDHFRGMYLFFRFDFCTWYGCQSDHSSMRHIYNLKKTAYCFISNATTQDYYKPHILNLYDSSPQKGVSEWYQCLFQGIKKYDTLRRYPPFPTSQVTPTIHLPPYARFLSHHQPSVPLPQPKLPPIPIHQQCTFTVRSCCIS